jgi:hypothetical protein
VLSALVAHENRGAISLSPPNVHVFAAEEAGPATLRQLVRCANGHAGSGDTVLIFGPASWVSRARKLGLSPEIEVVSVASVGGSWWLAARLGNRARADLFDSARQPVMYGARAQAIFQAFQSTAPSLLSAREFAQQRAAYAAFEPSALPMHQARRDRLRRAWQVGTHEVLVHLLAEPITWIDPRFVVRAIGMAAVGGARLRLLASPEIPRIEALTSWLSRATGMPPAILAREAEDLAEVADALDAVVVDADGIATDPAITAGARSRHPLDTLMGLDDSVGAPSILPALEAVATGIPLLVHRSYAISDCVGQDVSSDGSARVMQFDQDVAELSCMLASLSPRAAGGQSLAKNAMAASR